MNEDTMATQLTDQPWLEPFLEDADDSLEPARLRFRAAQASYGRRHGIAQRHRHGDVLTTALDLPPDQTP